MGKREFVQLAHVLDLKKHTVGSRFVSEKLDGERAIWDGGVSRGCYADEVPWANTAKDKRRFYATGLWTRRGKVIHAPAWWLDRLPKLPLDGELFAGRGRFQMLSSIVRNQSGTSNWQPVEYRIFDIPIMENWLCDGNINDTLFKKQLKGCFGWWFARARKVAFVDPGSTFQSRQFVLKVADLQPPCILHPQESLPWGESEAIARLNQLMIEVLDQGGEGLIIKTGASLWRPERVHDMHKFKPFNDMEATVVGYTTGRETNLGSKLLGKMGALICKIPAGEFKVSGFTDAERELGVTVGDASAAVNWATAHPDQVCPGWIFNPKFPVGTAVTIKYRELTDSGLPKEGRYWRKFS